jgi:hypothetical protein
MSGRLITRTVYQVCTDLGRQCFVEAHRIFMGPQYGTFLSDPPGVYNFEVPYRFLENLCTPAIQYKRSVHSWNVELPW